MSKERKKKDLFDLVILRSLETLPHSNAQVQALELIESSSTKPDKKAHLKRDIQSTKTTKDVSRIMWNTLLSGDGNATLNSRWQQMHGHSA